MRRDYLDNVLADKTVEPHHLEIALYVAAVEVASARGIPLSEVRIFSPLHPSDRSARFFDGKQWVFLWRSQLIAAILQKIELAPLDLIAWRELPPPEKSIEWLASLRATHHEWVRLIGVRSLSPDDFAVEEYLGDVCSRCKVERLLDGEVIGEPWKNYEETACRYDLIPWEVVP